MGAVLISFGSVVLSDTSFSFHNGRHEEGDEGPGCHEGDEEGHQGQEGGRPGSPRDEEGHEGHEGQEVSAPCSDRPPEFGIRRLTFFTFQKALSSPYKGEPRSFV